MPDFFGSKVTHDLDAFKVRCGVIVADRWRDDLFGVAGKVYTRDLFKREQVSNIVWFSALDSCGCRGLCSLRGMGRRKPARCKRTTKT